MKLFFNKEDDFGIFSFEQGMILYDNVGTLKDNFEKMVQTLNENLKVIIDFAKISFIDSSGLGFLVNMSKKIKAKGSKIILAGLEENVNEIFRLTGVLPYFTIVKDKEKAKNYLQNEE